MHTPVKNSTFAANFIVIAMNWREIIKIIAQVLIAALTALLTSIGLTSCNVSRVVTNQSEYFQKGDTAVVIQTKTIETYDAYKR